MHGKPSQLSRTGHAQNGGSVRVAPDIPSSMNGASPSLLCFSAQATASAKKRLLVAIIGPAHTGRVQQPGQHRQRIVAGGEPAVSGGS